MGKFRKIVKANARAGPGGSGYRVWEEGKMKFFRVLYFIFEVHSGDGYWRLDSIT